MKSDPPSKYVHIGAGNANVKSGYIGGDLVTYNNTQLDLSEDTVVSGERIEKTTSAEKDMNFPGLAELSFVSFVWKFVWNLVQGVGLILLAFLVYKLAPVKFERALMQLKNAEQQLKSFGVGCLVFPLGILVSIFLLISVVGWPILGLLLALAFIAKTLTTVFVGTKVGILILKPLKLKRPVLFGIIAGILLVQLLTAIPFIGGAVEFLVFFVGIGAIVRAQYFKYKESKGARKGNRSGDRNR
ncbi:MAG: hypothetical protein US52_C0028G0009 [candidate division WS6 bacterium GW2011_GWA2_37_6]|uniref:DUF8173 domain-containing protein n=1 Tax=candidate division WS6 bacterium GW2011_GWA2_37_6 TaxID=1619087 RepID=A0A0G0K3W9_9BACT|nr:MAG: hypothetical protein US52_C0028G0009 [candidate division WS6 bacterium GW2011_GWA2_37_6]